MARKQQKRILKSDGMNKLFDVIIMQVRLPMCLKMIIKQISPIDFMAK